MNTQDDLQQRQAVIDSVKGIAAAIAEGGADGERDRRLPDRSIEALRRAGLVELWAPREYGGKEADARTVVEAVEQVARVDGASAWVLANLTAGAALTAYLPPEGARELYTNGPAGGFPGSVAPKGRAEVVEGGYLLSGRWPLASGCHHSDWLNAVALAYEGENPRTTPQGLPDLRIMFFRREECEILDTWSSLGLRGTGSNDFTLDQVFVPESRTFSFLAPRKAVSGVLYDLGILPLFSLAISAVLPGIAQAAIDTFVALAREKTPTLSDTGLATRPTIHAEIARAEAALMAARALLHQVSDELMEAAHARRPVDEELEARRRLACANVGAGCTEAVERVFRLAGSTPIYSGNPLERYLRDIQTANQHLFFSPVWWEKTGQRHFGLGLGMP